MTKYQLPDIVNFLIADGLVRYGKGERASRLATDLASMINESGFFEYFDPMSGNGLGGDNFSWTAAIWLGWLNTFGFDNRVSGAAEMSK